MATFEETWREYFDEDETPETLTSTSTGCVPRLLHFLADHRDRFPELEWLGIYPQEDDELGELDLERVQALLGSVDALEVEGEEPEDVIAWIEAGLFARAKALNISPFNDEVAEAIVNAGPFPHLETLQAGFDGSAQAAVLFASASQAFPALKALDMFNMRLGAKGAKAIAGAQHFSGLTSLRLSHINPGQAGLTALLSSPVFENLETLTLSYNQSKASAWKKALAAMSLPSLVTLNIESGIWEPDEYLREDPFTVAHPRLTTLSAHSCFDESAESALRASAYLPNLETLKLTE